MRVFTNAPYAGVLRSAVVGRFIATTTPSDSCFRFRGVQVSQVPVLNFQDASPSYTPPGRSRRKSNPAARVGFATYEPLATRSFL